MAQAIRLRERINTIIGVAHSGDSMIADCHLVLSADEHQAVAHHGIKRALGAASLRTRWLELDEVA